jgi:hypothetical protein
MSDRPDAPRPISPDAARRRTTAIAAIACLYRQWRIAGRELERLARDLTCYDFDDGFRALDRVCAALQVTDALIDLVAGELAGELALARRLRREMFAELLPWLEAVRRELPGAATLLYSFTSAAATWREVSLPS